MREQCGTSWDESGTSTGQVRTNTDKILKKQKRNCRIRWHSAKNEVVASVRKRHFFLKQRHDLVKQHAIPPTPSPPSHHMPSAAEGEEGIGIFITEVINIIDVPTWHQMSSMQPLSSQSGAGAGPPLCSHGNYTEDSRRVLGFTPYSDMHFEKLSKCVWC